MSEGQQAPSGPLGRFLDDQGPTAVTAVLAGAAGKKCPSCGRPYKPHQKNQEYCSRRCYDRAYNRANPVARQRPLPLDPPAEPLIQPRDQRVRARRRAFSAQAQRILARLEAGPVANVELALMFPPATAWRSRLSDVRWELRRRLGLVKDKDPDPIPGYDCGGGIVWHWIGEA